MKLSLSLELQMVFKTFFCLCLVFNVVVSPYIQIMIKLRNDSQ